MLNSLPPDILDHIAFFAATRAPVGPPSGLLPLLATSRAIHGALDRATNPHLYARIFGVMFDAGALSRRFEQLQKSGKSRTDVLLPAHVLAHELVTRCRVITRFRTSYLARSEDDRDEQGSYKELEEMLLVAFVMTLENEGRNVAQLREYGCVTDWLAVFWFDARGASTAVRTLEAERFPLTPTYFNDEKARSRESFAMWLLWLYLDPQLYKKAEQILKLVALNGMAYPLSRLAWSSFDAAPDHIHFGVPGQGPTEPINPTAPAPMPSRAHPYLHYAVLNVAVTPLPPAVPALLSLLALQARARRQVNQYGGLLDVDDLINMTVLEPFVALPFASDTGNGGGSPDLQRNGKAPASNGASARHRVHCSRRWDTDWLRCIHAVDKNGDAIANVSLSAATKETYKTFVPGSFEGSWEGVFTYTEFSTFSQLLSGLPPSTVMDCLFARHNQTWRIKEYHFLDPPSSEADETETETRTPFTAKANTNSPSPLPIGEPLLAHIPDDTTLDELDAGTALRLRLPAAHNNLTTTYTRATHFESEEESKAYRARVRDIVLVGEGHSGWGEFRLVGRVRPSDGFVSIMKEYTGGDRGRWLYRGYLIGEGEGIDRPGGGEGFFAGRWRETLTPAETFGYEGFGSVLKY